MMPTGIPTTCQYYIQPVQKNTTQTYLSNAIVIELVTHFQQLVLGFGMPAAARLRQIELTTQQYHQFPLYDTLYRNVSQHLP